MTWAVERACLINEMKKRAAEINCMHIYGTGYCSIQNHGHCLLVWGKENSCIRKQPKTERWPKNE